ncbi:MAG: ABC transporter permease [Methanomicrobiales archaeon]|nr:ABC transporter permease [Methanomicrobiales archaeon]
MNEIIDGFVQAIDLIVTLNPEVMEITVRTLEISLISTALATLISIPLGGLIHFREFRGKRALVNIIQTLYALPTVIAGLFVFLLISRAGPAGSLRLLFTPAGMVLAQVVLIIPIMVGLTLSALSGVDRSTRDTIVALGASESQSILTMIREARFAILGSVVLGFGRAISEVGAAMMIGGNIRGFTRVLTTAIALETSMGNVSLSLALGMILLAIALVVNVLLNLVQQERRTYD